MSDLGFYNTMVKEIELFIYSRQIVKITGMTIDSPFVKVGECCNLYSQGQQKGSLKAEIIGTKGNKMVLMPYGECVCNPESRVVSANHSTMVPVGTQYIGRIVDGMGNPMDQKGEIRTSFYYSLENYSKKGVNDGLRKNPVFLAAGATKEYLHSKKGCRIGLLSDSKNTVERWIGNVARSDIYDVNVLVLLGGSTRDVNRFIKQDLKDKGLKKSVIIVATDDQPASSRVRAIFHAVTISEYFRDIGMDSMLYTGSLTDFAQSQRDVGLSTGEKLMSNGYTPSVFVEISNLLDRAGGFYTGSLTGICSVLSADFKKDDPILTAVTDHVQERVLLSDV